MDVPFASRLELAFLVIALWSGGQVGCALLGGLGALDFLGSLAWRSAFCGNQGRCLRGDAHLSPAGEKQQGPEEQLATT